MNVKALLALIGLLCIVSVVSADTESFTLYAGQTYEVGYIEVTADGGLTVDYYITPPSELWESHWTFLNVSPVDTNGVAVESAKKGNGKNNKNPTNSLTSNLWYLHGWMNKGGNPPPGQFPWEDGDTVTSVHGISVSSINPPFYIAAHGVVNICEYEDFDLPEASDDVSMTVDSWPGLTYGDPSYLDVMFTDTVSSDIILDTWYDAWCADWDIGIDPAESPFDVTFTPVFDGTGFIDGGVNWACITFLVNNLDDFEGDTPTWTEIQAAIWYYTDGKSPYDPGYGARFASYGYDADLADALRIFAGDNACCGYEPACGDLIPILVEPCGKQPLFILLPLDCDCHDETCWAANDGPLEIQFPGSNWATYVVFD